MRNKLCIEKAFQFIQVLFLVATGIDEKDTNKSTILKNSVDLERNTHGDILQLKNIIENYHNISYKVIIHNFMNFNF